MCNGSCKQTLFKRILVAVDESKQSEWATAVAGDLAVKLGAEVALMHAYRVDPGYSPEMAIPIEELAEDLKDIGVEILRKHRKLLPPEVPFEQILTEGDAAKQIVTRSEKWGADLIVMGTHGRSRIAQFVIGSTSEAVIRMARCPVLAIAHEPPLRSISFGDAVRETARPTPTTMTTTTMTAAPATEGVLAGS
jgi:nucleotide-binding universal stress UspA family protein